jgi:hypothetical protein|tara:strand:- start:68 stop:346 length:279 start_codon:yes stop_codon:yes gene_type:complete
MATSNIDKQSFGQAGAKFLSGTDSLVGDFCAFTVIEDAVLHATNTIWPEFTDGTKNLKGNTNSVTIPAGITIYGQFSKLGLDSGSILAYYAA